MGPMRGLSNPRRHMNVARFLAVAVVAAGLWLLASLDARAQEPFLPELTRPVNDFAGVVRSDAAAEIARQIEALQQATGDVVVVVTTPTFAPFGDIRQYAVKLFENHGRGIGEKGKDNGLMVLLAVNDRRVWIEVGYGLEGFITDGFSGETSRDVMAPAFRQGDYSGGLRAGVERLIGRIADGRGVKLDGVQPVRPTRASRGRNGSTASIIFIVIVLIIMVLNGISGGGPRYRRGGFWGGRGGWSGWNSGVGPFGGGGFGGGGFGGGGFGGGFGGFGGGRSGGGGGGAGW